MWFDGACGEGPNGRRQEYDWDRYYPVVRRLQPDAVIAMCGLRSEWRPDPRDVRPSVRLG